MQTNISQSSDPLIHTTKSLRILVADDDPSSRLYLNEALKQLGHQPTSCKDGHSALMLAQTESFDLLLLDFYMPGAGALEILRTLRQMPSASSQTSPAVATSAQIDSELTSRLRQEGFIAVLNKPCSLQALHQLINTHGISTMPSLLDDVTALKASGNAFVLQALRVLLYDELIKLSEEIEQLQRQPMQLYERLHRLRSSCGFCGAHQLAEQARILQEHARQGVFTINQAIPEFRQILLNTLHALKTFIPR